MAIALSSYRRTQPRSIGRTTPRVAIVHDYLTQRGGAERVVLSLLKAFPDARLVTSVFAPEQTFPEFSSYDVQTSFLDRVPTFRKDPRKALPLLAQAWSSLKVDDADVVLCSSSGWSHGVRSSAYKIVYCHNPARWLYQADEYLDGASVSVRAALSAMTPPLKAWDRQRAGTADLYLANSSIVQDRIRDAYGIEAPILHPPASVDVDGEQELVPGIEPGFVLTVGRPRGYKNTEAVCQALAQRPDWKLVVVGGLPTGSWPSNITGLTGVTDAQLRWLYANCSALTAVGREDFGLTVPEVGSFGKPVVAWKNGGYLDTVVPGVNGYLIDEPEPGQIVAGLERLFAHRPPPHRVLSHTEQFSETTFIERIQGFVRDGLPARTSDKEPKLSRRAA